MTQDIQYQVDQLLMEQGEYVPLELLLLVGRLSYGDYEAWRNGELDYLDEVLFGDPEHIQELLQQAADYMQRRGWRAETVTYQNWRTGAAKPLRFSATGILNHHFHQCYRKAQDQPQLDLFTDAPATNLANGISQALINRNTPEARRQLERLYDTAPDYSRLGDLEQLVEAAENLDLPVNDAATEMRFLQETLIPSAESLLGKASRNLLIPLWRRLSNTLQDRPYHSSEPELHLSYTAAQAMDWDKVRQAVEREPQWQTESVLLLRHAKACDNLHQQAAALQSWFALCWQFPEQCNELEAANNHELRHQWIAFQELETEPSPQSFPAWMLLSKPGLTRLLPDPATIPAACPDSYRVVYRLQYNRMHSNAEQKNNKDQSRGNDNTMALRAQLQRLDPDLFRYFLQEIDT
jgi:hypothetical protein